MKHFLVRLVSAVAALAFVAGLAIVPATSAQASEIWRGECRNSYLTKANALVRDCISQRADGYIAVTTYVRRLAKEYKGQKRKNVRVTLLRCKELEKSYVQDPGYNLDHCSHMYEVRITKAFNAGRWTQVGPIHFHPSRSKQYLWITAAIVRAYTATPGFSRGSPPLMYR